MNNITLDMNSRTELLGWLHEGQWVIACLCAAWCDTCTAYKAKFDELASMHPEQRFVWIDIEDQADVVGDVDVTNFPTLLIQHGDIVNFFGTVQPELLQADRLLRSLLGRNRKELEIEANSTLERIGWQRDCNLRLRLAEADLD